MNTMPWRSRRIGLPPFASGKTALIFSLLLLAILLGGSSRQLPQVTSAPNSSTLDGMGNPSAVYCREMGYQFENVQAEGGESGICRLPGGLACDAWAFLEGSCGQEFSLCAQRGLRMQTRSDGRNPFSRAYGVCVTDRGVEVGAVTALFNLPERARGCGGDLTSQVTMLDAEIGDAFAPAKDFTAPAGFDWRNYEGANWLTPIRNQSQCGSCWAFSAVGVAEAAHNIAEGNPDLDLNLSEEYLVSDCDTRSGTCCGGYKTYALEFIRDVGIPDEACMPYVDGGCTCNLGGTCSTNCTYRTGGACSDATCSNRCTDWESRLVQIADYGWVVDDPQTIKTALVEIGPLAVSLDMGGYWDGGIFRCETETRYTNHAVAIVGYSDAGGYWIVRNSWGASWDGDGYFNVGYGECSIEEYVYYAVATIGPPPANDDFNTPTVVSSMPFSESMVSIGATADGDDPIYPCTSDSHFNTVWYRYTPSQDGTLIIDTFGSTYDTVLAVWTGSRGSLTNIACNDDLLPVYQSVVSFSVEAGTAYHIEAADYYGGGGLLQINAIFEPVPPANDDFDSPEVISSMPSTETLETSAATSDGDDPLLPCTGSAGNNSVWYRFTPPLNGTLHFDTFGSDYDTVLGVWTGSRASLTNKACNDDAPTSSQSSASLVVTAGTVYHIEVADVSGGGGILQLNASFVTAANDDFNSPTVISGMPYTAMQDTAIANAAGDDPLLPCAGAAGANTVWYRYTPWQDGTLTLDTFGSDYDTVLGVWTGSRGSLSSTACNDDAPSSTQSSLSAEVTAGTDYYIEVADADGGGGNLQLNASFVAAPGFTWYLAEGYTGSGFQTFILIQNPNPTEATINVTYMLQGGGTLVRQVSVGGNSRYTIEAHDAAQVGLDAAFSTKLEADLAIVVERAMYWPNGAATSGGHVTIGVQQPVTTWYLAEGYTGGGFQTFILIQNPNPDEANVTVTYMLQGGGTVQRQVIVAGNSRQTVAAHDAGQVGLEAAFSTKLVADQPIIVERAMYFNNDGHAAVGVSEAGLTWYLAEGFTGAGFGTFILIQNPNASEADVTVTYMLQGGGTVVRSATVAGNSRYTIEAHDTGQVGPDAAFSTKLDSDQPIIVERAMYWANGEGSAGGHDSPGVAAAATTWSLAEGFTGGGFGTFILIQNPNSAQANVTVTYMLQGGGTEVRSVVVPGNSRVTIEAHDAGQLGLGAAFSTLLESDQPIIVERAMYFANGGHDTNGYAPP